MDLQSLFGNPSLNDEEKASVLRFAKQNFPHLVYDSIPIEWEDDKRTIKNKDTVSSLWGWQKEVMYNLKPKESPIVISHLTNGSGKASAHSSKVYTPNGFKLMGNIQEGDLVLTPDGKEARVLKKYPQGKVDIFEVSFSDDSSTFVTKDHLWEVEGWTTSMRNKKVEILSTEEISKKLTINRGSSLNYNIPLVENMNFTSKEVSIDPYLLGLLIGDGCFRHSGYTILSGDEFIPLDYLYNSRDIRLSILQGLMDTKGSITLSKTRKDNSRNIEFSSKSKQLCEDVSFLVRSLGGMTSQPTERQTFCNGNLSTSFRIHIQVPQNLNIFRTSRKTSLFNNSTCRMRKRLIKSIELVRQEEASCILIDHPRHLYITDNCIVTHNTWMLTLILTLLLIDDHPSLSKGFMGIKGDFWLLTNTSLLKTEYPKAFLKDPGLLGNENIYKEKGYHEISNSRGEVFQIKLLRDSDGTLHGFENITNGKNIKFFSYAVNEQKLAGHNPLSIFCDEFGDKTTTSSASGANRLTWGKFEEMIVRCGRNHKAADNWVFCLFFTLTLGEAWIEDLIDLAKDGRAVIEPLNKLRNLPANHQSVHLVKGTATTENPFINKSTIEMALGLGDLLGRGEGLARRLLSTDGDDPNLVFPRSIRPRKLSVDEMSSVIELSKKEPGWMFVETIDPGWRDKCAVLFALCHPVKGIFLLDEIYQSGLTVPKISSLVKSIEYHKFENRKVDKRMYDPNHIRKTTQESPVANYKLWKDSGLPGEPAFHSRDRSYDRMFELLSRGLIAYAPISCTGLDRELRVHRKDSSGVPEEKGSNHCFVAGSLIETKRGIVPIESINVDDYVLTTGGYKRVLDSGISGRDVIKSKFNIHTVYYTIIECTPNHLIRTFNTWTEAEKIKEGEMIYLSRTSMGKGITSIQVRDIILEELKDFIELSGSFIHQKKSLMDIMYTILMEILKIIGLKISNYLNLMSIYLLMLQSITKTRVKQQENTCKILEVLQKSGISLKKDGSGIETMPISQDLVHILLQRGLVNTVHETSWQQTTITVSALLNVKQNLIESQIIPLLKSIALSVVNYLLVENFNIRNIVPTVVKKITKYDTKRVDKVYDLTIEDFSEFFVNGVLVHNSIDALRYLANWFYEDYAKKIHLTIPTEVANISPERALYYQQLEYYNKFVKPIHEENAKDSTIFGVKLKGINKNNIKGFRR